MGSKAQKDAGYPIPEEYQTEETQSLCIVIPAGEDFRKAAYAQLLLLGKWWKWKHNEEPESQRAKFTAETWRLLFEFNEDCGGWTVTPEEFYDANKRAIYDAINDVAKQIVSGRTTNISVDDTGTVTDPTTAAPEEELPEDDPETVGDEGLEAQNGGTVRTVDYLQQILTRMFTWYSATTPAVTQQQAEDRLQLLYGFEQAAANTFANYWYTVYMNSSGAVTLDESLLDSLFFCRGLSIATFSKYIFETHTPAAEIAVLEVLAENLTQEQLNTWFNEGLSTPMTKYVTYSCTRIDEESATMNMASAEIVTVNLSGVWKKDHRYRIRASGTFTDSDNPGIIKDAFWSIDTSTGVKTFEGSAVIATSGVAALTQAEVPYSPSHVYNVIVEKTNIASVGILTRNNNPFNLPNTTGTLTFTITDEGEYVV